MDEADDDARLVALFMQQQQMIEALLATRMQLRRSSSGSTTTASRARGMPFYYVPKQTLESKRLSNAGAPAVAGSAETRPTPASHRGETEYTASRGARHL